MPPPDGARSGQGLSVNARIVIAVVVTLVLVAGIVAIGSGGSKDDDDAGSAEVFLEPAAEPGPDPFTGSAAGSVPDTTVPLATPVSVGNGTAPDLSPVSTTAGSGTPPARSFSGGAPGLYGGTRDKASCDVQKMATFLEDNPAKARAWAQAQGGGLEASEVPDYVRGLTPVILRADTRVTNFGYKSGEPTARQSVLQAGTAVLIDQYGEPQAKCNCGNPLNVPKPIQSKPVYTGPKWPGFTTAGITVIVTNTTVINTIIVIDVSTGTPFGRPTGPGAGPDTGVPTGSTPATTTTSSPATTTTTGSSGTTPSGGDVHKPGPGIFGSGAAGCDTEIDGTYLERVEISSSSGEAVEADQPNAADCYALVFSGNVDMDNNNSFEGGFDPTWCFDPEYCDPKASSVNLVNGQPFWTAYGASGTPPYSPDHVYTIYIRAEAAGAFLFRLADTEYSDNSGSWFVDIYG